MNWLKYIPLIISLGSHDFRAREAAHHKLSQHIDRAIVCVLIGEQHPDPEIAARCRVLAKPWFERHARRLAESYKPGDKWPWIDSLSHAEVPDNSWEYWDSVHYYRELALATIKPDSSHDYPIFREATRLWITDLVAARKDVRQLIADLCAGHNNWCQTNGRRIETWRIVEPPKK